MLSRKEERRLVFLAVILVRCWLADSFWLDVQRGLSEPHWLHSFHIGTARRYCGANVDAKPENLVQFAKMGSIYMKNIEGIENPRVGIINIGAEDEKGNELVKSTIPLLRECKDINFIGSVESRDIPNGPADVLVCEAFVGNVLLKFFEGLGKMFMAEIKDTLKSSVKTKIGGALIYKPIKKTFKRYMADDKGGAPLLGLKGLVVKIHGNSKDTEVRSAIEQCRNFVKKDVTNQIIRTFVEEENKGEN